MLCSRALVCQGAAPIQEKPGSRQAELEDEDSARGSSWTCLDLHLAPLLQHETGAVGLK